MASPARLGGIALVVIGLGLLLAGLPTNAARIERSDFAFLSTDRPGITAHNSPAVAVDPNRPEHLAMADKIDTPTMSCSVSVSENGGDSWDPLDPVAPEAGTSCFWPDVAFDDEGDLLVIYTASRDRFDQSTGVWLQRFGDGQAEGGPTRVAGPHSFHPRLVVDGSRVWATWVQFNTPTPFHPETTPVTNPVVVAASADGGRTFDPPVSVSAEGQRVLQPSILLGPQGEVIVGALDLGEDVLDYESRHEGQQGAPYDGTWDVVTWTSTDGGRTFGPASVVSDLVPAKRVYPDVSSPTPGFAVSPVTGRLFATWDGGRGTARDVYVAWSDDAGGTWQQPRQLARERSQALPAVAVSPDGRVDVLFYDRSRDPTDNRTEVRLATSWDDGESFTTDLISDRSFDARIGFGSFQGLPSLGQQLAVIAEPDRSIAFWSDTRKGNIDNNAQELTMAHVDVKQGEGRRWPLVGAGAVLAGAGLALALRRPTVR